MTPPYSEAPIATNFSRQNQPKTQSSAHWAVIAGDLVNQIRPAITGDTVFVARPSVETDFSRTFRSQIISALSTRGIKIGKESYANVLTLDVDAKLVHFSPGRQQNKYFLLSSAIATGYWVSRGLDLNSGSLALVGSVGATTAFDRHNWLDSQNASGPTPEYELIVTVSVSNSSQILGQRTDVYYIADSDKALYVPPPPVPPKMTISGGA
jgi:hypothetical protein